MVLQAEAEARHLGAMPCDMGVPFLGGFMVTGLNFMLLLGLGGVLSISPAIPCKALHHLFLSRADTL